MTERLGPKLLGARCERAFSLVEIVIALAVTAFCVIAILGLFPVGANAAVKSRQETRAAYLAEEVVSDLRSSSFTNAAVLYQNGGGTLANLPSFNMAFGTTNYLMCDNGDNVLSTATAGQYASGVGSANANYLVQVTVLPTTLTNLSSISVEVSAPAQAALSVRSRYGFQTMIGNRQ